MQYSTFDIMGAFAIALFLSYLITPLVRRIAIKTRFLDHPQSKKKSHLTPIPLLGGIAIFFAFFVSLAIVTNFELSLISIFIGSLVLITVGLVDDKWGMMPNVKLAGQFIAALIVVRLGLKVDTIPNHYVAILFTIMWIMIMTNSFNLLDNLNGLSSGIAGISAVFFGLIAWKNGQLLVSTVSFALAGSCFGFLKHNFPKAHIFMGDAGSMVIGFILSCIAIIGCWETEKISISLSLPVLILSYPLFDTALVTIIRLLEKRPIFEGGKDHSSHILASLGFKKKRAVVFIYFIGIYTGISAIIMAFSSTYVGFAVMIMAYAFLACLGVYLLSVRLYKSKRSRPNSD